MRPDILLLGQITVDDTVSATPGEWRRQLGGNALFALAGARLWCEPERLGVVARVPRGLPFDVHAIVTGAGHNAKGLVACDEEALVEWILYEDGGERQSMPRNLHLRDPAADIEILHQRYLQHIDRISAAASDVPAEWLPATAIHLAPQVPEKHAASTRALRPHCRFLSVDPSPHYSRRATVPELAALLRGVTALLPSQAEVQFLRNVAGDWHVAAQSLTEAFPEVILKRGADGCVIATPERMESLPAAQALPQDFTGAGDAFCGAYLVNRASGLPIRESAMRATVTAAMLIETKGIEAALTLSQAVARDRLAAYRDELTTKGESHA
jgi:hypothetical protein